MAFNLDGDKNEWPVGPHYLLLFTILGIVCVVCFDLKKCKRKNIQKNNNRSSVWSVLVQKVEEYNRSRLGLKRFGIKVAM